MKQLFETPIKNSNEVLAQNNKNIVDTAMFNRLVEQVSQIASSLQELKTQVSHTWIPPHAPLPMMQYPMIPMMEPSKPFVSQAAYATPVSNTNVPSVESHMELQQNVSEETLEDLNIKALAILAKYHKQDENLCTIIAMLQYFLVIKCKQKFHSNWINKKDYTRAELLLALTTNPAVFGSDFESVIQIAWIRHLKDNQDAYTRILTVLHIVISKASSDSDVKHHIEKLIHYLLSPKNIVFTKKTNIKESLDKQPISVVKKPNVKHIVKVALDQILIQFLNTALVLQMLEHKDIFNEIDNFLLIQFKLSNYSHTCKYLMDVANHQVQERVKIAQEKRQKKKMIGIETVSEAEKK